MRCIDHNHPASDDSSISCTDSARLFDAETDEEGCAKRRRRCCANSSRTTTGCRAEFARPDPLRYRQNLLHLDPQGASASSRSSGGRASSTPIHDHTVWGLIGMLRGAETSQGYRFAGADEDGR
jgi:predicted metal-dependent enzyme (double-stranded beta helix superfamily)